jgi:hypothetical protein
MPRPPSGDGGYLANSHLPLALQPTAVRRVRETHRNGYDCGVLQTCTVDNPNNPGLNP